MMFMIFTIKSEFVEAFKNNPFYKGHENAIYSELQSDGEILFKHINNDGNYAFEYRMPVLFVNIIDRMQVNL